MRTCFSPVRFPKMFVIILLLTAVLLAVHPFYVFGSPFVPCLPLDAFVSSLHCLFMLPSSTKFSLTLHLVGGRGLDGSPVLCHFCSPTGKALCCSSVPWWLFSSISWWPFGLIFLLSLSPFSFSTVYISLSLCQLLVGEHLSKKPEMSMLSHLVPTATVVAPTERRDYV